MEPKQTESTQATGPSKGQIAYENYGQFVQGVAVNGDFMPAWSDVKPHIQSAWENASWAVINEAQAQEPIASLLDRAKLALLNEQPLDRSAISRLYAITITDIEKTIAFYQYILKQIRS